MRFAYWITKATNTHSEYVTLFFHCNDGYTNASPCYVYTCVARLVTTRSYSSRFAY